MWRWRRPKCANPTRTSSETQMIGLNCGEVRPPASPSGVTLGGRATDDRKLLGEYFAEAPNSDSKQAPFAGARAFTCSAALQDFVIRASHNSV
jgi:hypothetical protein